MVNFKDDVTANEIMYRLTEINKSIATTPSKRLNKPGWDDIFNQQSFKCQITIGSLLFIGDSIVAGLSRYKSIWKRYFEKKNAINCGIGGDQTQHVLWRASKMILPKNINHIVVHCGSNNLQHSSPEDIASAIILIGVTLTERCSNVKVLITGILPRGYQWTNLRSKIHKTNYFIKMFTLGMIICFF